MRTNHRAWAPTFVQAIASPDQPIAWSPDYGLILPSPFPNFGPGIIMMV
jgi:hypothetical protein